MRRAIADRAQMDGRDAYRCDKCGRYTVTVAVDKGATPDRLGCRTTSGCDGYGVSLGMPHPWPEGVPTEPRWEWYRPDAAALDRLRRAGGATWAHVEAGGLLIRRKGKAIT
jgi:hypothetical protein